MSVTSGIVWN